MSSSAPDGSGPSNGRRQSLSRYINKVKTVLTPKSKRQSISGPSVLAGTTSEVPAETSVDPSTAITSPPPVTTASGTTSEAAQGTIPAVPSGSDPTPIPQSTSTSGKDPIPVAMTSDPQQDSGKRASENVRAAQQTTPLEPPMRSLIQQDRARALFAKYGLTLEPNEWTFPTETPVARVEKPIRFRVRRVCHLCSTTFGSSRICTNAECGHMRCQKCPRTPAKKIRRPAPTEKTALAARATDTSLANRRALSVVDEQRLVMSRRQLKMPSRSGGQDLVYKPIKQRIHRTCDRCQTEFLRDSKTCATCGHQRCVACPRNPAKRKKYPNGYPGDVLSEPEKPGVKTVERTVKKTMRRVKWTCHVCEIYFVEGAKTCKGCQHERCSQCTRQPPKKIKPAPDPEVVKSVAEKLSRLNVTEASPEAEAPTSSAGPS